MPGPNRSFPDILQAGGRLKEYRVYTTKVEDNLGRVWDIGNGEHMPTEENVWAVNAWTEPVEALEESAVAGAPATDAAYDRAA